MRRIGRLPIRIGIVRIKGHAGLGVSYSWHMRVLDIEIGVWVISVEGSQL